MRCIIRLHIKMEGKCRGKRLVSLESHLLNVALDTWEMKIFTYKYLLAIHLNR